MMCVAQCYNGVFVIYTGSNGIQAELREKVLLAVYCAHRLHSVLTDCLINIGELSDFYLWCKHCVIISYSNTWYGLFVESHCTSGQNVLELERTVQTRWFYTFRSISKVTTRFDCIAAVLAGFSASSDGEAACEVRRLLEKIYSVSFVSTLHWMKKVLVIVNCLSEHLQTESCLIYKALELISGHTRHSKSWEMITNKNFRTNITKSLALNDIQKSKSRKSKISARKTRSQIISIRFKDSFKFKNWYTGYQSASPDWTDWLMFRFPVSLFTLR